MKYTEEMEVQLHESGKHKGKPTGLRTPKFKETAEEISSAKHQQNVDIATLTVTTSKGVWDGGETSTNRLTNALRELDKKDTQKPDKAPHSKKWKMHDNTKVDVIAVDISEALDLIAEKMDVIIN